jgi:hypothetical protein
LKHLHAIPEMRKLAAGIVWFEPPELSLRDTNRFLAYAMAYATTRELAILRKHVTREDLKASLRHRWGS